ncbi:MAG: arylsulfatase A-like enzyme [Planctomycetota bacterium]|jgi:arylsulfatase A-like enzyme
MRQSTGRVVLPSLVWVLLLMAAPITAAFAAERPNLLLIVADDMGYGDLSSYGSLQIQTPHLDRLAQSGVRCTDGYVSNSVCAPSRAGLLTGRYGSRFGFEHNLSHPSHVLPEFAGLPLDEPLISDRLSELGYRTGIVGKWHLGSAVEEHHPLARGFDFFFGMLGGSHAYWPTLEKNKLLYGRDQVEEIRTPYLTDWFTLEAIDFIRGKGKAQTDSEAPWFLYLSYNTPHGPMQAKPEDLEAYAHIKPATRQKYCAMQHCMDQNIGSILAELEARDELENTLIVFLSDNGGSVEVSHAVNAPLRGTKGTFLEGGIRVPMIYHWPAQLKPAVYERPILSLDVLATFVTAAGGSAPKTGVRTEGKGRAKKKLPIYDSVDLLPYFSRQASGDPHETLYWRMALRGSAVRSGNWKLLRPNSMLAQLYDLSRDVGEQNDLVAEQPEVAMRLLAALNDWEVSLERNPVFQSDAYWSGYNRRLYAREFSLVQPKPDEETDIWKLKRPK